MTAAARPSSAAPYRRHRRHPDRLPQATALLQWAVEVSNVDQLIHPSGGVAQVEDALALEKSWESVLAAIWNSFADAPLYVHIMNGLGIVMILIYFHVFFAPYKRLRQAVAIQDWPVGGKKLNQIRVLIKINLSLGIIVIIVAAGGRYFII